MNKKGYFKKIQLFEKFFFCFFNPFELNVDTISSKVQLFKFFKILPIILIFIK